MSKLWLMKPHLAEETLENSEVNPSSVHSEHYSETSTEYLKNYTTFITFLELHNHLDMT